MPKLCAADVVGTVAGCMRPKSVMLSLNRSMFLKERNLNRNNTDTARANSSDSCTKGEIQSVVEDTVLMFHERIISLIRTLISKIK